MKIEENNKIIAEFMGFAAYNTSWDWLIPVVHKIRENDIDFDFLEIGLPIEEIYNHVVEFINEYNKNK
tara:strand:- start:281 stop:484 length:204 start_codon:yes stop_codon:yes gene_type:complete